MSQRCVPQSKVLFLVACLCLSTVTGANEAAPEDHSSHSNNNSDSIHHDNSTHANGDISYGTNHSAGDGSRSGASNSARDAAVHKAHENHHRLVVLLFPIICLVVGVACKVFFASLPVPYTVLLLIIGSIIGAVENWHHFGSLGDSAVMLASIDPHLMLHIFLPPLLFESAFSIKWYVFAKCAPSCLLLAGPGVLISSFFMGVVIKFAFYQSWTFVQSLLLGTILSATDPVAVVALLKELGAKESLSTTIEGESLLNDGTAVVMFVLLLKAAQQGSWDLGAGDTVLAGLWMVLGGVAWGVICGVFSFAFLSRVFNKPAIECTITLAMSYICFFAAEYWLKVSGVLALVALGLAYGYIGATYISPEIEHFMHEFWEFLAFVANTLVFLTTGLILTLKAFSSDQITSLDILILVGIYVAAHIARGLVSVVCWPVISTSGYGMSRAEAVVAWWGGLRGAVGLACALVVALDSQVLESSRHFALLVLFHTSGIVLMTLCINAVTIKRLLAFFGMDRVPLPKGRTSSWPSGRSRSMVMRSSSHSAWTPISSARFGARWKRCTG